MPEYIERGKLLKDIEESVVFTAKSGQPSLEIRGANKITARIMAAPAADVVEVVRCKDCRRLGGKNKDFGMCHCLCRQTEKTDYCSYGAKMG